jgi:hypothetical protein
MPLSWNEIRDRAFGFSRRWADAHDESSHAKPFWIDFFEIFGITDKRVATFEHAVTRFGGGRGRADLYDPLTIPPALRKAHQALDAAVDAAYGRKGFRSDAERVAFLFELYRKYTSLLPASTETPRRTARARRA